MASPKEENVGELVKLEDNLSELDSAQELVQISSQSSKLLSLPPELIDEVELYLGVVERLSLCYTCRHLFYQREYSAGDLLGDPDKDFDYDFHWDSDSVARWDCYPDSDSDLRFGTVYWKRLQLLCMLDRDNLMDEARPICSYCCTTHTRSLFSQEALLKPASERLCLGSEGELWGCPHFSVDYDSFKSRTPKACHYCDPTISTTYNGYSSMQFSVTMQRTLCYWKETPPISPSESLGELLQNDTDICSHMRLSHAIIQSLTMVQNDDTLRTRVQSICAPRDWIHGSARAPTLRCDFCPTTFYMSFVSFEKGSWRHIRLAWHRDLDGITGVNDPKWLAHLIPRSEAEKMRREAPKLEYKDGRVDYTPKRQEPELKALFYRYPSEIQGFHVAMKAFLSLKEASRAEEEILAALNLPEPSPWL